MYSYHIVCHFEKAKQKKNNFTPSQKNTPSHQQPPKIQVLFTHPNQPAIKHFATLSPYRMKQQHPKK